MGQYFFSVTENEFRINKSPTGIYLFEFSNINSKINFEICSKLAIEAPDVLVSLVLTLNIFDTLFKCFFVDFEHVNGR